MDAGARTDKGKAKKGQKVGSRHAEKTSWAEASKKRRRNGSAKEGQNGARRD